ncbi:hypothetical protein [Cognatishimia sp. MH4019]|uniref:hypothetical protein n=1 Tax=Cognatishimia sp. MH4019 TaxID=2854030 RepID=UPI001CD19F7D|nr:hypothetical protein [Cognatishimia sp. MH4019]
MHRFALLLAFPLIVAGCSQTPISGGGTVQSDLDQVAFFNEFPTLLFSAAGEACNGPGDVLVREDPGTLRCEVLPDPPSAAALILGYDGTIEDLPKYVIAFDTETRPNGYIVRNEAYIRVPQMDGGELRIKTPDRRRARDIRQIFTAAGGTMIAAPAE